MSVFALCDFEGEVQVLDKTRFDASKSFAVQSSSELTEMTIKPGSDGSEISVFNADPNERHLDWCFSSFGIDVDSSNNSILFLENGVAKSGTVATATYASVSTYATAVAAAMTAAGTQTYTASVSNNVITISAPTTSFQFKTCSVSTQCFMDLEENSKSHESELVEYGLRAITIACGNGTDTSSVIVYCKVYTVDGDRLFTNDTDVIAHEPDMMKWVSDGRSSFKNVYRRTQKLIMAWLDKEGYVNTFGDKYTKNDIIDIEEVRQWSTFMSLRLIFQGMSNAVDDVFDLKAKQYAIYESQFKQRLALRLDTNKDGTVNDGEEVDTWSGSLFRR